MICIMEQLSGTGAHPAIKQPVLLALKQHMKLVAEGARIAMNMT